MDLVADIGATNTRFALLDEAGMQHDVEVFANADHAGLEALLEGYLESRRAQARPRRAALAIAAPVVADRVRMVNIDWTFSQAEIARRFELEELLVVNDFAALARSLPELEAAELEPIGSGRIVEGAAKAALGPGSGLGIGAVVPTREGWAVVGGEGGHITLPVASDAEEAVVSLLRRRHGHCSAEMLLSGPGLVRLYTTLGELEGGRPAQVRPEDVTRLADDGDALAARALEMFFCMLGTVASNLALEFGARGGIYIGGGIVPRLKPQIAASSFRERFVAKGDYGEYLASIPTLLITARLPALRGLRAMLGYG